MLRRVVAIHAEAPVYRAGLTTILTEAGYDVHIPPDPWAWARARDAKNTPIVLIAAIDEKLDLCLLERLSRLDALVVLAVLEPFTPVGFAAAMAAGAAGAISSCAPITLVLLALDVALAGHTMAPVPLVRSLVNSVAQSVPSTDQIQALRLLAAGMTVASVAEALHCSEREMYRRLRTLYIELGVTGRSGAVLRAVELGLLPRPRL